MSNSNKIKCEHVPITSLFQNVPLMSSVTHYIVRDAVMGYALCLKCGGKFRPKYQKLKKKKYNK